MKGQEVLFGVKMGQGPIRSHAVQHMFDTVIKKRVQKKAVYGYGQIEFFTNYQNRYCNVCLVLFFFVNEYDLCKIIKRRKNLPLKGT